MTSNVTQSDAIEIADAPQIPGLTFRHFRGESDFPKMVAVIDVSSKADHIERVATVEEVSAQYAVLTNCDPATDMIFAEMNGEVIGYGRVTHWQEDATKLRIYLSFGFLMPAWRRKGIGTAMLKHNQQRLREIAAEHPDDGEKFFQGWADEPQVGANKLLLADGYKTVTYGAMMVRPDLENIPDVALPEGLELRPAREEDFRAIWEADHEAFRDHYGYSSENNTFEEFLISPDNRNPELWKIAWDGDRVAGQVRSFINEEENAEFNQKRGWTESISVRREWRRKGVARALLCMSLQVLREQGMTDAALGVHTENPNGAFQLYESVGFRVHRMSTEYRKPMD
jgi:ribosomal protein S18 acetylase RimI-like enzyme